MKPEFFGRQHTRTSFVQLDTRKCKACWKCLGDCPNQVIGKVDLPWHKHALIINPDRCNGCSKCMKICEHGAYSKIDKRKQEAQRQKKKTFQNFLINNLLLISGVVMALSGLSQQLGFHMGEHGEQEVRGQEELLQTIQYEQIRNIDTNKIVWGFNYSDWSTIHKYAIVFFSLFMIYHIYVHWRLYTGVLSKHLLNKNIQVITLSVLFIFVAVTGLVPWVIDLSGGKSILRLLFIEIHDKIALVFIIYLILHLIKRNKWFVSSYARLIKEKP